MRFVSDAGILKVLNYNQKTGTKMEEFVKLLDKQLAYIWHEIIDDTVYIYVKSNREENKDYSGEQKNVLHESRLSAYDICRNLCISPVERKAGGCRIRL